MEGSQMPNSKAMLCFAAVVSISALFASPAFAQQKPKKISYEEAFKRCKAFMDKEKGSLGAGTTSDANKSTRGASCMKRFGHRL
jgi:hypothetical protein